MVTVGPGPGQATPTSTPAAPPVQPVNVEPHPADAPRPYHGGVNPPTGQACRVHFRRDALGMSSPAALSVRQETPVAQATVVAGTIDQVTDDWLVLKVEGNRWWIPRPVILMVELTDQP